MTSKCPCCNQVFGGRTFGNELSNFRDLIHETWQEGMRAALLDATMNRENCRLQCPYEDSEDVVLFNIWVGGAHHGMCWRHERPDQVAKWLLENDKED
jgi:hypothetical protein